MDDFLVIKTFTTRLEAEIAKGFLTAYNIQSIIASDDEGGMSPFPMQLTPTGVLLLVKVSDFNKAENLLRKTN